jgi:hypothetical protein
MQLASFRRVFETVLVFCTMLAIVSWPAVQSPAADDRDAQISPDEMLSPGVTREEVGENPTPDGPLGVFAAVERAWASSNADSLLLMLDPEEKVSLSFAKGGPCGGYFNRDQAYYLLKDMFEYTKIDRFMFQKYWNLDSNGRSPYAVAIREFRMNDGAAHGDQVYISLRRRGPQWVVGEIRTLDP